MSDTVAFESELLAARGGGHVVAVDEDRAESIGAKHMTRVRGDLNGTPFRSNLVKRSGTLYLGVHKATIHAAGVAVGDNVTVSMRLDTDPRPVGEG
jgi:Domain of unknown function (DUF1905)